MPEKDDCCGLALFLREQLTMKIVYGKPEELTDGTDAFGPVGSKWTGFYDWLRSHGTIVGIRENPSDPNELLRGLPERSYVKKGAFDSIEIFFGAAQHFDPIASCDQSFGVNQLWQGADGTIALFVSMSDLRPREMAQLRVVARKI